MGILSMGKTPRPVCDVCKARVEMIDIESCKNGDLIVTVYCHGDMESFTIPYQDARAMNNKTKVGKAFIKGKLCK